MVKKVGRKQEELKINKSMQEFMKSQLAKTKQIGGDAVFMVCKQFL